MVHVVKAINDDLDLRETRHGIDGNRKWLAMSFALQIWTSSRKAETSCCGRLRDEL